MFYQIRGTGTQDIRCDGCGTSLSELARTGMTGCAKCYVTFEKQLAPYIGRIHGDVRHTGSIPRSAGAEIRRMREIERLKTELSRAVEIQDFENAARLRDLIKEANGL